MKTLFNNLLKTGSLALILLASVFTLNASAATVTVDMGHGTPDIKKVIVTGSTRVILVQSDKEFVTMDSLDMKNVAVTQLGSALTINSNESNPVTVTVYVKNPYRIDASGKSDVKTQGKFNLVNLQVILKDDATARVKATTGSIYTVINDRANLQLIGTTGKHVYQTADVAKMDTAKFAAVQTQNVSIHTEAVALNVKGRSNK
ncbi:MAG: DUF2807 domain-containing protein [Pedobacter sp.]|uniref:GIN domain-containing protein n=1 Tax=Pedobacter sp. TaxID=1411316 RepID=UPI003399CF5F